MHTLHGLASSCLLDPLWPLDPVLHSQSHGNTET